MDSKTLLQTAIHIDLSWSVDYSLNKNWLRKLRTIIALPIYFLVLDFTFKTYTYAYNFLFIGCDFT